jgi:PKD repeat protein
MLTRALAATAITTAALAAQAQAAPNATTQPSVAPDGISTVGQEKVGSIGEWTGTGPITYTLRWRLCNSGNASLCDTRASLTTTNPAATLAYTPVAGDNLTGRRLFFEVSATDSAGTTTLEAGSRAVLPNRRWYVPTAVPAASNSGITSVGDAVIDSTGTTTVVTFGGGEMRAYRIDPTGSAGPPETIPGGGTGIVATDVDDGGRVFVLFLTGDQDLKVAERAPGTDVWTSSLLAAGAEHQGLDSRAMSVAGSGVAAVAWVKPSTGTDDDDDPDEVHIATRAGDGTWSTGVVDQPRKHVTCEGSPGDGWVEGVDDLNVAIAPNGDVTAVWNRRYDRCDVGQPHVADNTLDAIYRRGGSWTALQHLGNSQGLAGLHPERLEASAAGTVLVYSSWFEDRLFMHEAGPGAQFSTLDVTSLPTPMRDFRGPAGGWGHGLDLDLDDDGYIAAAWNTFGSVPDGIPTTLEADRGQVGLGLEPYATLHSAPDGNWSSSNPEITLGDAGAMALTASAFSEHPDPGPVFATRAAGGGWSDLQTVDYDNDRGDAMRWTGTGERALRFTDAGALYTAGDFRGITPQIAASRLALGRGLPFVQLGFDTARPNQSVTVRPWAVREPDGLALTYAWDLDNDGQYDDSTAAEPQVSFATEGEHTIRVRVTATDGESSTAAGVVSVAANSVPTITGIFATPDPPDAGQQASFAAFGFDDRSSDQLTYAWSFDGVPDATQTGSTATHTFASGGTHSVSVAASDAEGGVSSTFTQQYAVSGGPSPPPAAKHTLTVAVTGTGDGTLASSPAGIDCVRSGGLCSKQYDEGTNVILTADPADGSSQTGWLGCDAIQAGGSECVVSMDADTSVTAFFDLIPGSGNPDPTDPGTSDPGTSDPGTSDPGTSGQPDPPQTKITSQKAQSAKRMKFEFTGSGGQGALRFECSIDDGKFAPCESPLKKSFKPGKHTLEVRAVDERGVADETPAKTGFKIKKKRRRK